MNKNEIEEPKDLGIKIGTKEEAYWTKTKKECEEAIANNKRNMLINQTLLELSNKKIEEEKKK